MDGAPWQPGSIDTEALKPDFEAIMSTSAPTCRSLDRVYEGADQNDFWFYMIDGFIVSDNVQVNTVETLDLQFTCSDHNPVRMTFTLKQEEKTLGVRNF